MTYSPSFQEAKKTALMTSSPALLKGDGVVTVLYVRPTGNDETGDGLTVETAFATLAFAMQQIPLLSSNQPYLIDVTGIDETLDSVIFSPTIPNPIASYTYLNTSDSAIDGYFIGPLCIHADLQLTNTIDDVDVISINADPTTGMETIVTSGGLAVDTLVGKFVRQFGSVFGVVTSNTTNDIVTTSGGGLTAGVDLELCDPGAQVNNLLTLNQASNLWFEGLILQQEVDTVAVSETSSAGATFVACHIGAFEVINGDGTIFSRCRIIPSDSGNTDCRVDGILNITSCYLDGVDFVTGGVTGHFTADIAFSRFNECGPLGVPLSGGAVGPGENVVTIRSCSFINPSSGAVNTTGFGSYQIKNTTIDGSAASPLRFSGPFTVFLDTIPAGAGNIGIGCQLSNGARVTALAASVDITGATGDVKVGNLATQTWASVTGAGNNRSSDFSATGDGSTAHRA